MKKNFLKTCLLAIVLTALSLGVQAQNGPPPDPPSNPAEGGNGPVGGGAPIAEGMTFLMLLATGYGVKKYSQNRNKEE